MKHRLFKHLPLLRCCAVLCPFECEPSLQIRTTAVLKFLDALEESFAGWDPQDFDAGTSHSPLPSISAPTTVVCLERPWAMARVLKKGPVA